MPMYWGASYAARYRAFKAQVDADVGSARGKWGSFKAFFAPNHMSAARKAAVDRATVEHRAAQLYRPENVHGYTGNLNNNPTVYYRRPSGTFGRITQAHDVQGNVGRARARKFHDFQSNQGVGRYWEQSASGQYQHQSRNPYNPVNAAALAPNSPLRSVHQNFPDIKQRNRRWVDQSHDFT